MGEAVRYDGGSCSHFLSETAKRCIDKWQSEGFLIALCPEVAGGLPVPRPAAEICNGSGFVKTNLGDDVTAEFQLGAEKALAMCRQHAIKLAILKQGSPSCGNSLINDGSFSKVKIEGQGVTAKLLTEHGIQVFNEFQIEGIVGLL